MPHCVLLQFQQTILPRLSINLAAYGTTWNRLKNDFVAWKCPKALIRMKRAGHQGSQQHFNYYNQNNQETLNNNYNSIYQTPRASYKSPTIPSASIAKSSVYSSRPAERHLCEVLDSLKRIRNTISNSNLSDSNPDGNGSFEYDTLTPSSSVFPFLCVWWNMLLPTCWQYTRPFLLRRKWPSWTTFRNWKLLTRQLYPWQGSFCNF